MQKAPQLPNHGALHENHKLIVVQELGENQEFGTIEQSNIGSRLLHAAKGQKVRIHCLGSVRDGMSAIIQSVQKVKWYGQEVTVAQLWIEDDTLPPRLRSWQCPLPGNENIYLELESEVQP